MPTRINGNDVTIPGTLFLTGPGVEGFALALGPGGAVIPTSVSIANLELLNAASSANTPNTLVLRNASGDFAAATITAAGIFTAQVQGSPSATTGTPLNLIGGEGGDNASDGGSVVITGGVAGGATFATGTGVGGNVRLVPGVGGDGATYGYLWMNGRTIFSSQASDLTLQFDADVTKCELKTLKDSGGAGVRLDIVTETATDGNGGPLNLLAGSGANGGSGGGMSLFGGNGEGAGNGGQVTIEAGSGGASGTAGDIALSPGSDAVDGGKIWLGSEQTARVFRGKLQLMSPDDSLFYDVMIRIVAGVPTLAVEGAGEA